MDAPLAESVARTAALAESGDAGASGAPARLVGFVIVAGHLDIEWYQPLRSYRFWTLETLDSLLRDAAQRDDFVTYVLDGQVYPLDQYLDVAPEETDAFRDLIARGKLAVGPFYTQFDEWLPSAESMVRNCLRGVGRARALGGEPMRAGYLPDNFGHPRQLPQILRNFGIDSLLFMRGMPAVPGGDHPDEFWYAGPDGSRVLASHFRDTYSGAFPLFRKPVDPPQPRETPYYADYLSFEHHRELADHDDPAGVADAMIANVRRIHGRYPSGIVPLVAGYDHLPPQVNIGDSVREANRRQDGIEFVMGTAEDYIRAARERLAAAPGPDPLPTYTMELIGSRYQYILFGALSSRVYLKQRHFACEALLEHYAEPLETLAALHGHRVRPRLLAEAWTAMFLNGAHDSIHGSSVDEVHREMESRYAAARQIAAGVIHDALAHLARRWPRIDRREDDRELLVYAPSGDDAPQPVETWLAVGDRPVRVFADDGRPLPTVVHDRAKPDVNGRGEPRNTLCPEAVLRRVAFQDVFAAGELRRYRVRADENTGLSEPAGVWRADDASMENGFLRVEARGALLKIVDKRSGRVFESLNLLEEEADAGDAWDFSEPWTPGERVRSSAYPFTVRLDAFDAARATLAVDGVLDVPARLEGDRRSAERVAMPVTFRVTLRPGVPRVDVRVRFVNTACDHRLRLRVATGLVAEEVLSQGQYMVDRRPVASAAVDAEAWAQPPTPTRPFREWFAVRGADAGLAVAVKGLYAYEAEHDAGGAVTVSVALLRGFGLMDRVNTRTRKGAASGAFPVPDAQCPGVREAEWAYVPFAAQGAEDGALPFLATARAFLNPPVAHAVRGAPEAAMAEAPAPPVRFDAENIRFSAFKRAEDGDGVVLRFYEDRGLATATTVRLDAVGKRVARVWRSDMAENRLDELPTERGCVRVRVDPFQVVTLRFRPEP